MLAQRIAKAPARLHRAAIDDPRWTAFIESQPDATLFHHPAWVQALAEAYGYDPFLIIHADEDGNIVAGMPVLDVRSALRGRRRISLPFTDYCPPLARNAQRLTFFCLRAPADVPDRLASALNGLHEAVRPCTRCFFIAAIVKRRG